jgi:hypothetical protein
MKTTRHARASRTRSNISLLVRVGSAAFFVLLCALVVVAEPHDPSLVPNIFKPESTPADHIYGVALSRKTG